MIQTQTILKVADNSGVKTVKCIGFVDTLSCARIGDCIIVPVRSLSRAGVKDSLTSKVNAGKTKAVIKKGQIFKALVIRTKQGILNRKYGHKLFFQENSVILINNQGNLVGSRIFGPITRELRVKNFRNILSYSDRIL